MGGRRVRTAMAATAAVGLVAGCLAGMAQTVPATFGTNVHTAYKARG